MNPFARPLTLSARLYLMAALVALAIIGLVAQSSWTFYAATLEQRMTTTRSVVKQSMAIAEKFQRQELAGQLDRAAAQAAASKAIGAIRYDGTEYVWINDLKPVMVMHPIKPALDNKDLSSIEDANGKRLFVEMVNTVQGSNAGYVDYLWPKPGSEEAVPKRSYVAGFKPWGWVIGSGVYIDDARAAATNFAMYKLLIGLFVSALVFFIVNWLSRGMRKRLAQAEQALHELADGNLSTPIDTGRQDELGSLLRAVVVARDSLASIVTEVRTASDRIATASTGIESGNRDLSTRTDQTAASLKQTSGSITELTSTVGHSADAAATATELATNAAQVAQRGGKVVSEVVATMQEINASSEKIADIISVIDSIAFQTNILALNAAVEAARAGEQGRGFAVVAGEVGSLAKRSAEAAMEIKGLIGTSVERVEAGSRLVVDAGSTMDEIVASVQRVTETMSEISTAAQGQSSSIASVNSAVSQLDQMTRQNASLVQESTGAATSLKEQALKLAEIVGTFKLSQEPLRRTDRLN